MTPEQERKLLRQMNDLCGPPSDVPFMSGRPDRTSVISDEDIRNLKIMLYGNGDNFEEFLRKS